MANGFMGKILWVDLTNRTIRQEELPEGMCRAFVGGYGLGARIIMSRQKAKVDPLGPQNILGLTTGIFTGTPAIGGSRYIAVGKSPLTNGWGDANSGGFFGPKLKASGFDAIFFEGISEEPVYLYVENGRAEIRDARHLWGKDTYETEDTLRAALGNDIEVACIGPAGEKLSLIAAIINNRGRAAARSGLGAVMGSKRLKAVVVRGDMKIPIFNEERMNELRKKYLSELTGHVEIMRTYGTPGIFVRLCEVGDAPTKNWTGAAVVDFPDYPKLGGDNVIAREERKYACFRCPLGCGGHMKEGAGEYSYPPGLHKPEYETIAMFGSNLLNSNLDSIFKANDICNRYGLDTISAGAAIAFTIESYERGVITRSDTDGLEMTWGNHRAIVAMTEKLAKREGFGDIIADGIKRASERIGKGSEEWAIHVQGQEVPAHDPKYGYHWAITYWFDPTPARHTQGGEVMHPPGLPIPPFDAQSFKGRGEAHKIGSNFTHVIQAGGMCLFLYWAFPHVQAVVDFINALSGWDVTLQELLKTGERIANIRQAFNVREGLFSPKFKLPARLYGKPPLDRGPLKGITIDEESVKKEYLEAMDWDLETARPSKRKLLELGLEDVVKMLYPEG